MCHLESVRQIKNFFLSVSDKVKDGTVRPYCRNTDIRCGDTSSTTPQTKFALHTEVLRCGMSVQHIKIEKLWKLNWLMAVISHHRPALSLSEHITSPNEDVRTYHLHQNAVDGNDDIIAAAMRSLAVSSSIKSTPLMLYSTIRADTDEWEIRARVATQKKINGNRKKKINRKFN